MKITLNDTEHALVQYIAQHKPSKSRIVLEYAKHSGIYRSDVKALVEKLVRHEVIAWYWDGFNVSSRYYAVKWNPIEMKQGWREC